MRRYYIVSGILLILPIIDFALAAPVLVQEKRQAGFNVLHIPEDVTTMLEKRGDELDELILVYEDHFAKPEEPPATHPSSSSPPPGSDYRQVDIKPPPPSHPEGWSPVSSPESLTESGYELMKGDTLSRPSSPAESNHESTAVHAPLSSPVIPTWFHTDNEYMGPHPSQPNLGPSDPRPSTESNSDDTLVVEEPPSRPASPIEFDADHEYQVVHPPSPGSASPTESDHGMVDVSPSSSVSSTGANSRLENLQAVSDALKGNAKKLDRISGTAKDVPSAAQRELQRERSLDHGE